VYTWYIPGVQWVYTCYILGVQWVYTCYILGVQWVYTCYTLGVLSGGVIQVYYTVSVRRFIAIWWLMC
jgi:hypothetical protein